MMKKNSAWLLIVIFALLSGCGSAFQGGGRKPASLQPLLEKHSFLEAGQQEESGFGLYSYILFKSRPTALKKNLYIEMILKVFGRTHKLDKHTNRDTPKKELHVTYFLIQTAAPKMQMKPEAMAEWILEHYDYQRAGKIMRKASVLEQNGPLLLSAFQPLTSSAAQIDSNILMQNFSKIPSDRKHLIHAWVDTFFNHASIPQKWDDASLSQLVLDLRTGIARAARIMPLIQEALVKWIEIVKPLTSGKRIFCSACFS